MSVGSKVALGLVAGGYIGYQGLSGFNGDKRITHGVMDLTLGDPNAIAEITGRDMSITQLALTGGLMQPNAMASVAGGVAATAGQLGVGSAMITKSKNWKGKLLGAGLVATSPLTGMLGYSTGKYAPESMRYAPAFGSGLVNSTTVTDYNKANRSKMPTVSGDVVLGMYNTRLA